MERRQFIANTGILAAGLVASNLPKAQAAEPSKAAAPSAVVIQEPAILKLLPRFAETADACALKGTICVQHCEDQLAKGDTEMAHCMAASRQMVVVCEMVAKLATMKSVRLAETLDVCASTCKACKEACEEHKAHFKHGMHMECKACAEHCDKMLAEIKKLKSALGKA